MKNFEKPLPWSVLLSSFYTFNCHPLKSTVICAHSPFPWVFRLAEITHRKLNGIELCCCFITLQKRQSYILLCCSLLSWLYSSHIEGFLKMGNSIYWRQQVFYLQTFVGNLYNNNKNKKQSLKTNSQNWTLQTSSLHWEHWKTCNLDM